MSTTIIDQPIIQQNRSFQSTQLKVLKFGGKSLDNNGVSQVLKRIVKQNNKIAVVVSARGNATDVLLKIINLASSGKSYQSALEAFCSEQQNDSKLDLSQEFQELQRLFDGIYLLRECSTKTQDKIVSYGEIISAKYIAHALNNLGVKAKAIDAGDLFVTNAEFGNAQIQHRISAEKTKAFFNELTSDVIPIVTGFIAKNIEGERTTLGRNGSNYSAALLANYLNANILENYTHVDGIFTANPDELQDARQITELTYLEAAEIAQFGTNILHAKTIEPLISKEIPLRILNTFGQENQSGTLISNKPKTEKVRAISALSHKALIRFEGKGLLGKVGVDARIFGVLKKANISVGMISQESSERAIGLVIDEKDAQKAVEILKSEFTQDIRENDVDTIVAEKDLSVLAIIGLNLNNFDRAYKVLIQNKITPILFNNTINGNTICLLLKSDEINKAKQVIHGELFERPKRVHIAVIGHGTVGKTFVNQVIQQRNEIIHRKNLDLRIFAIANSTQTLFQPEGIDEHWEASKSETVQQAFSAQDIIQFAQEHYLENLILVDNTAHLDIAKSYPLFIENGFDVVSSNKIANTLPLENYKSLRNTLDKHKKRYAYETNVGAGLPLIDTIRLLHISGENITKIKGVFSGSLSYIFNRFSSTNLPFSEIILEAVEKGYTEPDPREDLNGNDVARKLLILARELDFEKELEDVEVQNLIPKPLRDISKEEFFDRLTELDKDYDEIKALCPVNHVLRYTGELQWDLNNKRGSLKVNLVQVDQNSPLGQIKGADSIFEIYTDSYGDHPLVIQGAGAGAEVTARGVFGDVLRLADKH